jgi:hypothetical protein
LASFGQMRGYSASDGHVHFLLLKGAGP